MRTRKYEKRTTTLPYRHITVYDTKTLNNSNTLSGSHQAVFAGWFLTLCIDIASNRPLPSSKSPQFQNEGCTTFLLKMSFICMRVKNDFDIKGWAPTLVLKQRPRGTRKWPILAKNLMPFLSGVGLGKAEPWQRSRTTRNVNEGLMNVSQFRREVNQSIRSVPVLQMARFFFRPVFLFPATRGTLGSLYNFKTAHPTATKITH